MSIDKGVNDLDVPVPAARTMVEFRTIAQCFLRLSNFDPTLLDHAGSYETPSGANDLDPRGDTTAAAVNAAAIAPPGGALQLGSGKVGSG